MEKKKVAVPLVCHGHSRPLVDLFYSPVTPDDFFLISANKDSTPMSRNGETGDWIGKFEGHKGAVWSSCLDTNALCAASASVDFSAYAILFSNKIHFFGGNFYRAKRYLVPPLQFSFSIAFIFIKHSPEKERPYPCWLLGSLSLNN
ncbi:hypothetical protein CRYUN_Cryun34aG0085300 [Craigia yunnanensis]